MKHAFPLTRFGVATRLHVTMLRDYCVHFTRICANGTRFAPHMLQLKRTLVFREYVEYSQGTSEKRFDLRRCLCLSYAFRTSFRTHFDMTFMV